MMGFSPFDSLPAAESAFQGARNFSGWKHVSCERSFDLDRRQSYYDCTQHDWKQHDFDGRMRNPGPPTSQPLLSPGSASTWVPLVARRPSAPYRLGRAIVNAFTGLVFGENRWPSFKKIGDTDGQQFATSLAGASSLRVAMIRARNLGGGTGASAVSFRFDNGTPKVKVHNVKHIHVSEWQDRADCIPAVATEAYLYPLDVFDPQKQRVVQKLYWWRRDWTPVADIIYREVEYQKGKDPVWEIDPELSVNHSAGQCRLVWIQNSPHDDPDSIPDYDGQYDALDTLDILNSVIARGAVLNLDPTVVLKMDPDIVARMGVKKGSDNALVVGPDGDASYMELGGSSIEAGIKLFEMQRRSILEATQSVIPDPNQVAASGISAVAQKLVYAPALNHADILREQYGSAIARILNGMTQEAKNDSRILALPFVEKHVEDPETGEVETTLVRPTPSEQDGDVDLVWPEYFAPTPMDQLQAAQTIQAATASQIAFMSKESAVEQFAIVLGRDPSEEWERVDKAEQKQQAALAASFGGDMGGEVDPDGATPAPGGPQEASGAPLPGLPMPGGAKPLPGAPAGQQKAGLTLAPTDIAMVVTVNEARAASGLPPLMRGSTPDPDGDITLAEFKDKHKAVIASGAAAQKGQEAPTDPNAKPPLPPGAGKPGLPGAKPPELGGLPKPPIPPEK